MKDSKLSFFMREDLKKEEIKEFPGLDRFKDTEGKVIPFQVKVLGTKEIQEIREGYKTRKMVTEVKDGKRRPVIVNGEVAYSTEYNGSKANDHIIAEALVVPNLKDPDMMAYYGCVDMVDMPKTLFKHIDDYSYVSGEVAKALGLLDEDKTDDEMIEDAKN